MGKLKQLLIDTEFETIAVDNDRVLIDRWRDIPEMQLVERVIQHGFDIKKIEQQVKLDDKEVMSHECE